MERVVACASLMVCLSTGAYGQVTPKPAVFEVASVRPNRTRGRGTIEFPKGGERFTATNTPLAAIIVIAYDITVRQFSGSDPLLSERYDIAAKADHPAGPDEMLRMLRALLADRFHLAVQLETREVPVYALTVAKGGTRLRPSAPREDERPTPRTPARAGGTESGSGHLIFQNESMPDFAWALSRTAAVGDRVVVDQTGLHENYDFELTFVRDSPPLAGAERNDPAQEGPSIFSALQEQLGLKLEPMKAPVEFLTVQHVERPAAN
jgi:uncharacterized protein (TIGR03435 family)